MAQQFNLLVLIAQPIAIRVETTGMRKCRAGREGDKGKWVRGHALGVASQKTKGGKGRKGRKQAIPHGLHLEILQAAK